MCGLSSHRRPGQKSYPCQGHSVPGWAGLGEAQPVSGFSPCSRPFPVAPLRWCGMPMLQMEEWALTLVSSAPAYRQSFSPTGSLRACSSPSLAIRWATWGRKLGEQEKMWLRVPGPRGSFEAQSGDAQDKSPGPRTARVTAAPQRGTAISRVPQRDGTPQLSLCSCLVLSGRAQSLRWHRSCCLWLMEDDPEKGELGGCCLRHAFN